MPTTSVGAESRQFDVDYMKRRWLSVFDRPPNIELRKRSIGFYLWFPHAGRKRDLRTYRGVVYGLNSPEVSGGSDSDASKNGLISA